MDVRMDVCEDVHIHICSADTVHGHVNRHVHMRIYGHELRHVYENAYWTRVLTCLLTFCYGYACLHVHGHIDGCLTYVEGHVCGHVSRHGDRCAQRRAHMHAYCC